MHAEEGNPGRRFFNHNVIISRCDELTKKDLPLTPYQRVLASPAVDETVKHRLRKQLAALDPVALRKAIRESQRELAGAGG